MEILPECGAQVDAGPESDQPGPRSPDPRLNAARSGATIATEPVLSGLLDTIDQGVLLIDMACRVVYSNRSARATLDTQAVLCRDGERVLPAKAADRLLWRRAIEDALHGQARLFETHSRGTRHVMSIAPFQWTGSEPHQKYLMILLGPAPAPHSGRLEAFAEHCGLTRSETKVFLTLLDDLSPNDIALRLEVAPATVRTHIRRILQKSGSPSMRSLLALITRLPPICRGR